MSKVFSSIQYVDIDYNKLRKELKKRNISLSEASIALGHTASYINTCEGKHTQFKQAYLNILELNYSIKPEDILLKQEEPEEKVEKKQEVAAGFEWLTAESLYQIIYSATYNAMTKALSD